ncbi:kinase-like domain-containing protein [Syncephalis fuscata]|nr:kinase-like domain-containing protein [Syncephalis fuscata]
MPGLVIDELRTDRESRDEYSAYVTYNDMPGFLKCTYHTDLQDNEIDTLQELNQLDIAIPKLPNWPGYTEPIPFQSMIAQLLTHFTTADGYGCVVLELIDGIRLNDYMSELGLLERIVEMRDIVRQLLIVLIYLNYVGWSHGDIKPKNIMVQVLPPRMDRKPHVRIVLVDFNMAAPITYGPFYPYGHAIGLTPPEYYLYKPIDMQQYDSWTLGATIYTLITGEAPYEIDYTGEFSITWPFKERRDFMFSLMEHQQHIYTRISYHRELQDFIDLLMQIDPAKRLTPEEIMWHNWLK